MKKMLMILALSAASGMASATSVTFNRDSSLDALAGGVSVFSVARTAGHIGFIYNPNPAPGTGGGQFASGSFATFCIELDQTAGGAAYNIVDLSAAPNPPTGGANPNNPNSYGSAIATRIATAAKAGMLAGWIGSDLSLITSGNASTDKARMAAIQAVIWEAIYDTGSFDRTSGNVVSTSVTMNSMWDQLAAHFANDGQVAGLRAAVSSNRQDQLYVVPLPPAAFAGLATLVGIAGVSRIRRR